MDIELSKLLVSEVSDNKRITLSVLNVVFYLTLLVSQRLSSALSPLSLGEITDLVNPMIAPSGYAFSIWGLIYALVFSFVIY